MQLGVSVLETQWEDARRIYGKVDQENWRFLHVPSILRRESHQIILPKEISAYDKLPVTIESL